MTVLQSKGPDQTHNIDQALNEIFEEWEAFNVDNWGASILTEDKTMSPEIVAKFQHAMEINPTAVLKKIYERSNLSLENSQTNIHPLAIQMLLRKIWPKFQNPELTMEFMKRPGHVVLQQHLTLRTLADHLKIKTPPDLIEAEIDEMVRVIQSNKDHYRKHDLKNDTLHTNWTLHALGKLLEQKPMLAKNIPPDILHEALVMSLTRSNEIRKEIHEKIANTLKS